MRSPPSTSSSSPPGRCPPRSPHSSSTTRRPRPRTPPRRWPTRRPRSSPGRSPGPCATPPARRARSPSATGSGWSAATGWWRSSRSMQAAAQSLLARLIEPSHELLTVVVGADGAGFVHRRPAGVARRPPRRSRRRGAPRGSAVVSLPLRVGVTQPVTETAPITLRELDAIDVAACAGSATSSRRRWPAVGIETVLDLVTYYPRRWVDRSKEARVSDLQAGRGRAGARDGPIGDQARRRATGARW